MLHIVESADCCCTVHLLLNIGFEKSLLYAATVMPHNLCVSEFCLGKDSSIDYLNDSAASDFK